MKKYSIILLVVILALACAVCGCNANVSDVFSDIVNNNEDNGQTEEVDIEERQIIKASTSPAITVDELYIPDGLREDACGLYFVDYGSKFTKSTDPNVNYDPSKPLVIYFHGNAFDDGYYTQEGYSMGYLSGEANQLGSYWLDKGYNVAVYYWPQFADEAVLNDNCCGFKIWSTENAPKMRWAYADENGKKVYEEEDMPNCCLAEMFGAYYIDILDRLGFEGNEIRFTGHSMGAQFAIAASSYITTKALGGVINARYIPDRVTLYDGYYEGLDAENYYCDWLDRKIGADGTLGICKEIVQDLRKIGVAVEHITSTAQTIAAAKIFGKDDICEALYDETQMVTYSSEYLSNLDSKHQVSKNWYIYMNSLPVAKDASDSLGIAYAVSPNTPTSYVYARMGTKYEMEPNYTFEGEDDVQYSTNITTAKVAGFAFLDKNQNGINDDGICSRLKGVKVNLISGGNIIATTTTAENGYYSFDVDAGNYVGLQIEFKINSKYSFATQKSATLGEVGYMSTSDADANGVSNTFDLQNIYSLQIVNVGLIKK